MDKSFGAFVRSLRGGETRKAAAARAGISAEYLRQIETEGRIPKEDKVIALAQALGYDPKDLLARALRAKSEEAAEALLNLEPRWPRLRTVLSARLIGPGADLVREALEALAVAPQERSAIMLWAGVLLMDAEGLEPEAARRLVRGRIAEDGFVEDVLSEYVARHLVSWQVDPETGRQTHRAASDRVDEFLGRMSEALGQSPTSVESEALNTARELADLLEEEEIAMLFHNLKKYRELSERDKDELRALWEFAGRMVRDRLARARDESES